MFLWHSRNYAKWFRSCVKNCKDGDEIKSRNETKFFFLTFGTVEYGAPQRVNIRAITFHNMLKSDLPPVTNTLPECIIITYDTGILIPSNNFTDFFSVPYLYFI
jgi:hypothetical protein